MFSKTKPVSETEFLDKAIPYLFEREEEYFAKLEALTADSPGKLGGVLRPDGPLISEGLYGEVSSLLLTSSFRKDIAGYNLDSSSKTKARAWYYAYSNHSNLKEFRDLLDASVERFTEVVFPLIGKLHQRTCSTLNQVSVVEERFPGRSGELLNPDRNWVLWDMVVPVAVWEWEVRLWWTGVGNLFTVPHGFFDPTFGFFKDAFVYSAVGFEPVRNFALVNHRPRVDEVKEVNALFSSSSGVSLKEALEILNEV